MPSQHTHAHKGQISTSTLAPSPSSLMDQAVELEEKGDRWGGSGEKARRFYERAVDIYQQQQGGAGEQFIMNMDLEDRLDWCYNWGRLLLLLACFDSPAYPPLQRKQLITLALEKCSLAVNSATEIQQHELQGGGGGQSNNHQSTSNTSLRDAVFNLAQCLHSFYEIHSEREVFEAALTSDETAALMHMLDEANELLSQLISSAMSSQPSPSPAQPSSSSMHEESEEEEEEDIVKEWLENLSDCILLQCDVLVSMASLHYNNTINTNINNHINLSTNTSFFYPHGSTTKTATAIKLLQDLKILLQQQQQQVAATAAEEEENNTTDIDCKMAEVLWMDGQGKLEYILARTSTPTSISSSSTSVLPSITTDIIGFDSLFAEINGLLDQAASITDSLIQQQQQQQSSSCTSQQQQQMASLLSDKANILETMAEVAWNQYRLSSSSSNNPTSNFTNLITTSKTMYSEASKLFTKALSLDPENPVLLSKLGNINLARIPLYSPPSSSSSSSSSSSTIQVLANNAVMYYRRAISQEPQMNRHRRFALAFRLAKSLSWNTVTDDNSYNNNNTATSNATPAMIECTNVLKQLERGLVDAGVVLHDKVNTISFENWIKGVEDDEVKTPFFF